MPKVRGHGEADQGNGGRDGGEKSAQRLEP
jgi:hypothetical protein